MKTNLPPEADQEELDFLFDEEMEQLAAPRKNTFTDWSDDDSDGELDDSDVNKILIVTQTPPYLRKHPGGDRTGNHISRAKITAELAKAINDGLYYYEQDLWTGDENQLDGTNIKVNRGNYCNANQIQVWLNVKKSGSFACSSCQIKRVVQHERLTGTLDFRVNSDFAVSLWLQQCTGPYSHSSDEY